MNLLFWKRQPAATATPPTITQVPQTRPEMVIVQYFNQQKEPREKVVTAEKYAELMQLAGQYKGDMSIALNNYIGDLP